MTALKADELNDYRQQAYIWLQHDIEPMNNLLTAESEIISQQSILQLQHLIDKRTEAYERDVAQMSRMISHGSFYIHRLKLLIEAYPNTRITVIGVVVLFLLPVLYKLTILRNGPYYEAQHSQARDLVDNEYVRYRRLLTLKFSSQITESDKLNERFLDPPYNTKRKLKSQLIFGTQDDLLAEFYDD